MCGVQKPGPGNADLVTAVTISLSIIPFYCSVGMGVSVSTSFGSKHFMFISYSAIYDRHDGTFYGVWL